MKKLDWSVLLTWLLVILPIVAGSHARAANLSTTATPSPMALCNLQGGPPCLGKCSDKLARDSNLCGKAWSRDKENCEQKNQKEVAECKNQCRKDHCLGNQCYGIKQCQAECDSGKLLAKCNEHVDTILERCLCGLLVEANICCANEQAIPSPPGL